VAEEDAVDDGSDGGLFVGVEVGDGFEAEVPFAIFWPGFGVVEDELIGVGVERGCESGVPPVTRHRLGGPFAAARHVIAGPARVQEENR